jgi:hypothetical protein
MLRLKGSTKRTIVFPFDKSFCASANMAGKRRARAAKV